MVLPADEFNERKAEFDREGYVVFEGLLPGEEVDRYVNALKPYLQKDVKGRNNFEGRKTNRVYALLAKSEAFGDMVSHPLVMQFVRNDLGDSALLSACLAINLMPGETVQPWHTDDGYITVDMPRPSFGISAFWALTDTTKENGATEILPRSHRWEKDKLGKYIELENIADILGDNPIDAPEDEKKVVELEAGSLMLTKGNLVHRGGANNSTKARLVVTPQYCFGWARQIENMLASVPKSKARKLSEEVRSLMGYSIHPPFIGYVDGVHPRQLLQKNEKNR